VSRTAPTAPPTSELLIHNRQRTRRIDLARLRKWTLAVLAAQPGLSTFELGLQLVGPAEMAAVNETFLNHSGSTDVITFDHADKPSTLRQPTPHLFGELFICLDDSVKQAREFRTSWQSELARYVIHGVLHLRGHDDLTPAARRKMKLEENRLLRALSQRFPLSRLARRSKVAR